jgi:hypothetical protein
VATTDTTVFDKTDDGAMYVTDVAVWFVSEPQAAPVHAEPEIDQVTL